jgi:hypothetical protein
MDSEVVERVTSSREQVLQFERELEAFGQESGTMLDAALLTRHWFAPGIYARELTIPAGTWLTGKIHRGAHLNIISAGRISVLTEHGVKTLEAPCTLVSDAGIKRAGYAHTDTVWTCIHANPEDCKDLDLLEAKFIAPSFDALPANTKPDELEVLP